MSLFFSVQVNRFHCIIHTYKLCGSKSVPKRDKIIVLNAGGTAYNNCLKFWGGDLAEANVHHPLKCIV